MASGPDVAVAPDGTATVVWSSRGGGDDFGVFARRIAPDGTAGLATQLSAPGEDALAPQVAVAPNGTAVVVWMRHDGADFRVQSRRIAPNGAPEEATRNLSGAEQDASAPQVAVAPDGTATVVWKRFDGFRYLVQARQVLADGTSPGPSQRLSEPKGDAVEPQVAVDSDGVATVVWSRFDGEAEESVVQTRRVEPDGLLAATTHSLSAAGENAIQPQVGLGPDGAATVVWNRFNGSDWIVQGQRLSPAGLPEGAVANLSAAGESAAEPRLAVDSEGAAVVVWDRFDGASFVVQARRLDADGDPVGSPVQLSAGGRDAGEPEVAVDPEGEATVLWSRYNGANFVVQRRDLAADGSLGATETLSTTGRNANAPALAFGADGTLAMTWRRFNGAGDVVQGETVPIPKPPPPPPPAGEPGGGSSSGGPGAPVGVAIDNSFRIAKVRRDPRRGTATLWVEVPGRGAVGVAGARPQWRTAEAPGQVKLRVAPKRGQRRVLESKGSLRLKVTVTYQPAGGTSRSRAVVLRLRLASSPERKGVR
jgi:hypothetical protein